MNTRIARRISEISVVNFQRLFQRQKKKISNKVYEWGGGKEKSSPNIQIWQARVFRERSEIPANVLRDVIISFFPISFVPLIKQFF